MQCIGISWSVKKINELNEWNRMSNKKTLAYSF